MKSRRQFNQAIAVGGTLYTRTPLSGNEKGTADPGGTGTRQHRAEPIKMKGLARVYTVACNESLFVRGSTKNHSCDSKTFGYRDHDAVFRSGSGPRNARLWRKSTGG